MIALIEYLRATHQGMSAATIGDLLETTAKKGHEEVDVDVLEELREEWGRAARKQGKCEGRAETLLEQLTARFGAVPEGVRARVLAAGEKTLSRWSIRVLTAPTLSAVFRAPAAKKAAAARRPAARKRAASR